MASRNFDPAFITPLAQNAVNRVAANKADEYQKLIAIHIEILRARRRKKAKFSLFNWFPTPYVEPTEEEARVNACKSDDTWFFSDMASFNHKWDCKEKFVNNLLRLSQQRTHIGEYVTIDDDDWKSLLSWNSEEERVKCGVVMDCSY